jgi:hypothetical protein
MMVFACSSPKEMVFTGSPNLFITEFQIVDP